MRVVADSPIDLTRTFRAFRHGPADPTTRRTPDGWWRATCTPDGPGTIHVWEADGTIRAEAWGRGADWLLEHAPGLVGAHDDPSVLVPRHPAVADAARRFPGLRIGRSGTVLHALVPAILGQRVTASEYGRSWAALCRTLGERAPGPSGLHLPPAADRLASLPYWWFHRFGIERRRADTIRRVAASTPALEAVTGLPRVEAWKRLTAVEGVGPWTAALVAGEALGDPDAVPLGDYHLPHTVAWALAGEPRASDERMLDLLEPYRGQRDRVVRLLLAAGAHAPRFGPRRAIEPIARR